MSEPAQPLSRRERRAMEAAAAAAEGEMTQALPVTPESISVLSRRERRRLERLQNPPETWTAEEEMIATGQMPAMTPELLAEQERKLAAQREAEARAEADAAAAYAQTAPEVVAETVVEPVHEEPVHEEPVHEEPAHEEPVHEEPVHEEPQPSGGVNEIPAELRHLFPPGSLQARGLENQSAAAPVAPVDAGAVDEIRRLTQEAMAGISRVTHADEEPAPAEPEAPPVPAAPVAEVPDLPVDVEELWNAPTVDEPELSQAHIPQQQAVSPVGEPVDLADVPLVQDVPHTTEPTGGEPAGASPVWSELVPSIAQQAPANGPLTAQGGVGFAPAGFATVAAQQEAAPTMWDTHPLTHPGATPVRELPSQPVQRELPRPDLTVLLNPQASPSVGPTPYASVEPLTTTGSLPNRPAEPIPGGGARHFRWAHLAVIGSIAFVLGVLAWNIARSQ